MELRILGPLVVVDDQGGEVSFKGARLRALLGLLVLNVGEVVAADRIIEELWGDDQPVDATSALQNQVSRLRASLRAAGAGDCIATRPPGYVLLVEPDQVDAQRFEQAVQEGRQLLASGEAERAATVLRSGLDLWRGDVLADLAEEDLAIGARSRWVELRRVAMEDRIDADLAAGRHSELVGELEAMVAAEPLRERRTAQLMVALYRSGRQADALRAFAATREHLAEELGIDPGAELRRLENAILTQDADLDAPVVARRPAVPGDLNARSTIDTPLTPCIGREPELEQLAQLVTDHRLVTLVGPGGAGKTRLSIEAGLRLGDGHSGGAVLVELASVEDPDFVVPHLTRALGLDSLRSTEPGHDDGSELAAVLGDRDVLVVVDNCEHLVDQVARVVTRLLGRCSGLSVLASSRQALGIPGEALFLVPPLGLDDAADLFEARAADAVPGLVVDDSYRATIEDICTRLDGMPLAIELAASRLRVFSVDQLRERLHDRFRVVTGGARGALPRHRTLRAVVDWSYDLLDDDERLVFARLAVFAGGCTMDAAEEVVSGVDVDALDVADVIARLVDKSLVIATPGSPVRFSMLQTLSEYGRERLAEAGTEDEVRRRQTDWLLSAAIAGERSVPQPGRPTFVIAFGDELDNLRAALGWAQDHAPDLALELAGRLGEFWAHNDAVADGWRVLSGALQQGVQVDPEVLARAQLWAGFFARALGHMEEGARLGSEALELARTLDDPALYGQAAYAYAELFINQGEFERAEPLLKEARSSLDTADHQHGLAYVDRLEGIVASFRGDHARALDLSRVSAARARANGDLAALFLGLQRIGDTAERCGNLSEASAAIEEALELSRGIANNARKALFHARLASIRAAQGRPDEAMDLADQAVNLSRRQNWQLFSGLVLEVRGNILASHGRGAEAVSDYETALGHLTAVGMTAIAGRVEAQLDQVVI